MNKFIALLAIVAVCLVGLAQAQDDHDHDHEEEVVREGKYTRNNNDNILATFLHEIKYAKQPRRNYLIFSNFIFGLNYCI